MLCNESVTLRSPSGLGWKGEFNLRRGCNAGLYLSDAFCSIVGSVCYRSLARCF